MRLWALLDRRMVLKRGPALLVLPRLHLLHLLEEEEAQEAPRWDPMNGLGREKTIT